jgi:hypothetical protein
MCAVIEIVIRRDLPRIVIGVVTLLGWLALALWMLLNGYLILRDLAATVF